MAKRPHSPSLSLSGEQIASLRAAMAHCSAATRDRGERYFHQDRVVEASFDDDTIAAAVRGGEWYDVAWIWDGVEWISDCSCPVGLDCKHAYAVGLFVLAAAAEVNTPAPLRQAGKPQRPFASILEADDNPWRRRDIVRRLLTSPPLRFQPYDGRIMDLLDTAEAEADAELLCWKLAVAVAALTDGVLPAELEPYLQRADLRERDADREREKLTGQILEWVANRQVPSKRSLRFVWSLAPMRGMGIALHVEPRLTTSRLQDEPRTFDQLRQLLGEAQRNPGTLATNQLVLLMSFLDAAAHAAFGSRFTSSASSPAVVVAMLKAVGGECAEMVWATNLAAEIATRAGVVGGEPLRLSAQAMRVLPSIVTSSDSAHLQLMCVGSDDRQRSFNRVLYFPSDDSDRHPSFVLADGAFSAVVEEPPAAVRDRFIAVGSVDIPSSRCADLLLPMAQHFPHMRSTLARHTRLLGGKAVVALDLTDDDWLQIRLFFHHGEQPWQPPQAPTVDGARVLEHTPSLRWQPLDVQTRRPGTDNFETIHHTAAPEVAPSPGADVVGVPAVEEQENVWIEMPDPQVVDPALAWLAATAAQPFTERGNHGDGPQAADRQVGWWMKASSRHMAAFAEVWDSRPASLQFFGTERVRRLLSGAQLVRPKLSIQASGLDWFSVTADWEAEGLSLTDADMAKLRSAGSRFVKLASGWVRRDAIEAHDEAAAILADLGVEIGGGEQRITLWQLAGAKQESLAALEQMGADRHAIKALAKLRRQVRDFKGVPETPLPASITAELRPYQKRGLDFLVYTANLGIGTVLADDMGLGKTLQALAWLQALVDHKPKGGPSLVVCPTSVIHNWMREASQFAPELRVLALTRGEDRHELRKEIDRYDLVITNYALLRRDIAQWTEVKLRALILDEAQNIKNPDAAVSKAACGLQAQHRLALTGTPLENRPLDLWSIANFVNPGYLGSRVQFSMRFDRLDAPAHVRALLAAKLRPMLLRRLKREVATDLPERIEERRDCEMTDGQRQLYLAELRRSRKLVDALSEDPGALRKNKITILAALTRLRQICCHPALAKGKASLGSGKFDALFELLEPLLAEGHKVLLFSQFVQCLALLEKEMVQRDIAHHKLTGETVKREAVVQGFQEDSRPCVFLISLKAGGTGLNLTAASYVVLFDPWWNPAVEAQAIDRTHRIGQDRTVIAYRMLTLGTIEEKIWELQQKKSAMVRDVLGEDGFARSLDRDALSYLLQEI